MEMDRWVDKQIAKNLGKESIILYKWHFSIKLKISLE